MVERYINQKENVLNTQELSAQKNKMKGLETEVPKLQSLFKKTRLFNYLQTPELQTRFLNTIFYGLVAKESAFGTNTKHISKSGREQLKKLKIPVKIFKKWTISKKHNTQFQIPKSALKKYGLRNQAAAQKLIEKCTIDKGVYQITPINVKDIKQSLKRNAFKKVWNSKTKPVLSDRTNIIRARKLCVLSFERIYEICRVQVSTKYMQNNKQGLVSPIMIMGYKCGGGKANQLLRYANKKKIRSNALNQTIQYGLEQNIINEGDVGYLNKILQYRNQLQPNVSQLERNENQRSQIISESQKAREQLNEEVLQNNLTTAQPAQNEGQVSTSIKEQEQNSLTAENISPRKVIDINPSINFPIELSRLEYKTIQINNNLNLPSRPYLDPNIGHNSEIFSNQFDNQKTFGDFYLDAQNRTVDQISKKQLAISIIKQFTPRFSASQSSAGKTEIYKFPFGVEFKKITTKANTTINILRYNQNLNELYSETHLNYYNNWPINPGYSLLSNTGPQKQQVRIQEPSQSPNQLQTQAQENSSQTNELTWSDIFNESNPITEFSDGDVQYFILDTFMPERETEITPDGTTIHTDTYPFGIVVKTQINKKGSFQSMPIPDASLRKKLLRTPLKNYPRKPINIDSSYDVN
jgi:hypothetical protein